MRKLLIFLWLLLPVAAAAYHYGPGQDHMRIDDAAQALERAETAAGEARALAASKGDQAARAKWSEAELAYGEALSLLPPEEVEASQPLRLERAKAQMYVSQLTEARRTLKTLLEELSDDDDADPDLVADVRGTLANALYYTTWLKRLEGAQREEWEADVEASRQNYKWIASHYEREGQSELALKAKEDLEATIKLARLDLQDLQGLPLPSQ